MWRDSPDKISGQCLIYGLMWNWPSSDLKSDFGTPVLSRGVIKKSDLCHVCLLCDPNPTVTLRSPKWCKKLFLSFFSLDYGVKTPLGLFFPWLLQQSAIDRALIKTWAWAQPLCNVATCKHRQRRDMRGPRRTNIWHKTSHWRTPVPPFPCFTARQRVPSAANIRSSI